ncbi:MAG: thioredoxin 1 [Phycisphaerales bacterium]|jgi:thioredoxin 1
MKHQELHDKSSRFWRWFWLTFLVVSLAYAWYSFYAPPNRIAWADNYTTAQQQAAESDKPIILFFTGKWCSPCQIMKREVWADDQVMATVNADFIPVTIDVDNSNATEILSRYGIGATPNTIITDSQGNVLQQRQGRISKPDFLELLESL